MLGQPLDWQLARVPLGRRDHVLELSGGLVDGVASVAGRIERLVVLEPAGTQLIDARATVAAEGLANVDIVAGELTALPFADASFRTVLWREGLHRQPDAGAVLAEIRRVLIPHGWLGLTDRVVSERPDVAAGQRARYAQTLGDVADGAAILSASALQDLLVRNGFEVAGAESREVDLAPGVSLTLTALLVLRPDA